MTPFGNMHVKITVDPRTDRELEVFAQLGKGGDVATSDLEAVCRMISLWLRSGGGLRRVIKQLEGIGSSLQIPTRTGRIMSLGDGLATALKKYTRAKEHFGLRSLLLGEIDLAELGNPHRPPHTAHRTPSDRTLQSEPPADDPARPESGPGENPREVANERGRVAHDNPGHGDNLRTGKGAIGESPIASSAGSEPAARAVADCPQTATFAGSAVLTATETVSVATASHAATQPGTRGPAQSAVAHPAGGRLGQHHNVAAHYKLKCPECCGGLALQEGCCICHSCGWSAC
jgi:hypothetical protein